MKHQELAFIMIGILLTIITANVCLGAQKTTEVDDRTKFLCREYADRNHEKEFTPERYAANKDLIDNYDWYTSCINHTRYPVAGGIK